MPSVFLEDANYRNFHGGFPLDHPAPGREAARFGVFFLGGIPIIENDVGFVVIYTPWN